MYLPGSHLAGIAVPLSQFTHMDKTSNNGNGNQVTRASEHQSSAFSVSVLAVNKSGFHFVTVSDDADGNPMEVNSLTGSMKFKNEVKVGDRIRFAGTIVEEYRDYTDKETGEIKESQYPNLRVTEFRKI